MLKMQPISIAVESDNTYKVRFATESGEVSEYLFTVDSSNGFDLVICDMEFLELTNGDPAADRIKQCIGSLHDARHFDYEPTKKAR